MSMFTLLIILNTKKVNCWLRFILIQFDSTCKFAIYMWSSQNVWLLEHLKVIKKATKFLFLDLHTLIRSNCFFKNLIPNSKSSRLATKFHDSDSLVLAFIYKSRFELYKMFKHSRMYENANVWWLQPVIYLLTFVRSSNIFKY